MKRRMAKPFGYNDIFFDLFCGSGGEFGLEKGIKCLARPTLRHCKIVVCLQTTNSCNPQIATGGSQEQVL